MSKAAVITHTDFDGIFSGAMIYSAIKDDFDKVDLILSDHKILTRALAEVDGALKPYRVLQTS